MVQSKCNYLDWQRKKARIFTNCLKKAFFVCVGCCRSWRGAAAVPGVGVLLFLAWGAAVPAMRGFHK